MYLFFKSVAEAVVDKGLHGLIGLIPGAGRLYEIAESACKKYRAYCKDAQLSQQLKDIEQIAQAGSAEVKHLAHQVALEVAQHEAAGLAAFSAGRCPPGPGRLGAGAPTS